MKWKHFYSMLLLYNCAERHFYFLSKWIILCIIWLAANIAWPCNIEACNITRYCTHLYCTPHKKCWRYKDIRSSFHHISHLNLLNNRPILKIKKLACSKLIILKDRFNRIHPPTFFITATALFMSTPNLYPYFSWHFTNSSDQFLITISILTHLILVWF